MSKQAIIDKILSDADAKADAILSEAQQKASAAVAEANAEGRDRKRDAEAEASLKAPELLRRSLSVAELEVKKSMLAARQEVLGNSFDVALDKLCALPDKEYLSIIERMISSEAENGDVVVISQADKGRITPAFVQGIAKKKGITLTLSGSFGAFKGGVVLQSTGCDKNMSFEVELSALREEIEPKVSAMLF